MSRGGSMLAAKGGVKESENENNGAISQLMKAMAKAAKAVAAYLKGKLSMA